MQSGGLEAVLGLRVRGARLLLNPCIPRDWPGFELALRWRGATYVVRVSNPENVCRGVGRVLLDGRALPAYSAPEMVDDGATHTIDVTLRSGGFTE